VTVDRRDVGEIEALITDRYLDSLLALQPASVLEPLGDPNLPVGAAVRAVSQRLASDLPRFHPSFRFEERLALRLAEVAASMRLPIAAGGESQSVAIRRIPPAPLDPLRVAGDGELDDRPEGRQFLIGGAVAASALSLAGAWIAWRRRTSPMARAIRAAHAARQA
jgi:hypothetical protein